MSRNERLCSHLGYAVRHKQSRDMLGGGELGQLWTRDGFTSRPSFNFSFRLTCHILMPMKLYSTSGRDWHFQPVKSPFLIFILTILSNSTCLASHADISLPLPSFLFPLSPHLCLQVGWLSSRDKMADNFIVDDRQMSNDTEHTEVNHGLIIDVYAARTSTHARSISQSFPLRGLHIIPNLTWSTRPSPTSQQRMVPPCGSSHPDSHSQRRTRAEAKCS